MKELIRKLGSIRSGTVCLGADHLAVELCEELPFTVHEFESEEEHNGWKVPMQWDCQAAMISDANGNPIYDANAHPLGVASYSMPFNGRVRGIELKRHLFYSATHYDAIVYHCDWWYKQHQRSWGMCVPKRFVDQIDDDSYYHVDLQTSFTHGTMKVLEYVLPGESSQSIILNAHTCHPGCANDDLSGVAVGIEVMRYLALVENRKNTYRLIVAPEHYGSIFWLKRFGESVGNDTRCALFLESLGTTGELALQSSFDGNDEMDHALQDALRGRAHRVAPFRSVVGNDETCWDSAGIDIPCPSLSRCPFPEYHTSLDNADLMDEGKLAEAAMVVMHAMATLDQDRYMRRKFTGLVCLSNPKYDLYKPYFDPSIEGRRTIDDAAKKWNHVMDHLPRMLERGSILDLSRHFDVPFTQLHAYITQWVAKGLVEFVG